MNRKPQTELAETLGFTEFTQPSGGCCFLTDQYCSKKLKGLWQCRGEREYELDDIVLLKVGRHIRPAPHYKLIISREAGENRDIRGDQNDYATIHTESCGGPVAIVDGTPSDNEILYAAQIVYRFRQGRDEEEVTVGFKMRDGDVA